MTVLDSTSLLSAISKDRALGASMLFAHKHKDESPPFHVPVMDLWASSDPLVVIEAFREGAKTTLSEEFLLMEAAFGNFQYALIFGETYTKACQRIDAIKHEVATNHKLKGLFGDLKGATWSENRLLLRNGVLIEAHGWEEEIRGYKHRDARPDRAYLDDIENKEMVRDTATVDANWRKLYLQLIPAMDKDGKVRMTGTPLADDCMIARARAAEDWTKGHFPIADRDPTDPNAVALWPSRYPMDWIRAKREQFERNGMLREFNQEYMLIATGAQGKPFSEEMIRGQDMEPAGYQPRTLIIDPARTVEVKTSDQTGYVVLSKIGTRIYVHESDGQYWQPDEIVAGAFTISERHDAQVVIEKNSLDNWLLQPIRAMSLMTGKPLDYKAVNAPQEMSKTQFIMGLRPFFVSGDIILIGGKAKHAKLVAQILNFPTGKRDVLNALAYGLRVFSGVPVYGEFGDANICDGYTMARSERLVLGAHSSGTNTACVLVATSGRNMTVVGDWVSPLTPNDCIPDVAAMVRAMYPRERITAWVPADQFDQVGRNPLISALRAAQLPVERGEHVEMSRGALSNAIRTAVGGRRMLVVDMKARATLRALASGYCYPVRPGGERGAQPENGAARVIAEALECLSLAIAKPNSAESGLQVNAHTVNGIPYMSAMRR